MTSTMRRFEFTKSVLGVAVFLLMWEDEQITCSGSRLTDTLPITVMVCCLGLQHIHYTICQHLISDK